LIEGKTQIQQIISQYKTPIFFFGKNLLNRFNLNLLTVNLKKINNKIKFLTVDSTPNLISCASLNFNKLNRSEEHTSELHSRENIIFPYTTLFRSLIEGKTQIQQIISQYKTPIFFFGKNLLNRFNLNLLTVNLKKINNKIKFLTVDSTPNLISCASLNFNKLN